MFSVGFGCFSYAEFSRKNVYVTNAIIPLTLGYRMMKRMNREKSSKLTSQSPVTFKQTNKQINYTYKQLQFNDKSD